MRTLGVDPGLFGAVACWDDDLEALAIEDAPIVRVGVGRSLARAVMVDAEYARLVRALCPDRVICEQVNGIKGQSASASFNFGATYGLVRGFAAMLAVPIYFVTPQQWRHTFRVPRGKAGSRLAASRMYPSHAEKFRRVKDDGRAEASLLARFPVS